MPDRTHIPLWDRAIGEFLPGQAYFVYGDTGVGKTVLGLQVAHAWIEMGRTVLCLTSDPGAHVLEQASLLGLSLESAWTDERFILAPYTAKCGQQVRASGIDDFVRNLKRLGDEFGATAVLFDTIEPPFECCRRGAVRAPVTQLMAALREWGWSALILAGRSALRKSPALGETLREQCWGVIELDHARSSDGAGCAPFVLRVIKARQAVPGEANIGYAIALEVGLIPTPDADAAQDSSSAAPEERSRVLIGAGESEPLDSLIALLQRTMDVEVVADGVAALARAAAWKPEVLALQTDLPRLSGYAVARALRQGRYTMPVLLLSSGGRRRSDRVRALLNGATDFIESPFDVREVASRIRMASRMHVDLQDDGAEVHLLDVLIGKVRHHVVDTPAFLQALGIALRCASRFSSPVSLVAFQCRQGERCVYDAQLWHRFRQVLSSCAREGDLICFPQDGRAVTLLAHEGRGGALAFTARVRRLLERDLGSAAVGGLAPTLRVSSLTLEAALGEQYDLNQLLEATYGVSQPLFVTTPEPVQRTGTDGQ